MNQYGLSEKNMVELTDIFRAIPTIEKVVIFGSRARGDNRRESDVDLALCGERLTHRDVARLDDMLYYSYLPYYFDTLLMDRVHGSLRESIEREGRVLYSAEKEENYT